MLALSADGALHEHKSKRGKDKNFDNTKNKTRYFRLRLHDEVSWESLKTWDTPESLIWAQKIKFVTFRQLFIEQMNKRKFSFFELLSEPKRRI